MSLKLLAQVALSDVKHILTIENDRFYIIMINHRVEYHTHLTNGRLFVAGDLHGCYDMLMPVSFNKNEDLLVCLGDLVDRGPDSLKCLGLINQHWFKSIRGNHEQFCIDSHLEPEIKEIHERHGGEWFYHLNESEQKIVIQKLQSLPIVLQVTYGNKKYGFVHADIHLNSWQEFINTILSDDYYDTETQSAIEIALWRQDRFRYGESNPNYSKVEGIDQVFLGHTVVSTITQRQNCLYIDTGAGFGGQLTLIELSA